MSDPVPCISTPTMVTPHFVSRQKLLEAAARVFAESGFRGATTRRIAEEAGVNEVTLFRLFGSKAQLLSEAIECVDACSHSRLPEEPGDAEAELTEYCKGNLELMRRIRFMIRKTMAEIEERPEMAAFICEQKTPQFQELVAYASKLRRPANAREREEVKAACTSLMASMFADAVSRDIVPTIFPPEDQAAQTYVRVFLRLIDGERETQTGRRHASRPRASRTTTSR